jgi:Transposase DDE domain
MLESVTNAAIGELAAAGVSEQIDVVLADAGYWDSDQIENLAAAGMRPLVPPDSSTKKRNQGANRQGPRYDFMRRVIKSDAGHALYRQRKHAIEPIFGEIKHNRRIARFQRRGITACRSEWRLIATSHNILKLWRASNAPAAT